jgi:2,5-diketo-D-gluconate reductase B
MTIPPLMGLGTWGRTGDDGLAAILAAIEIGFRHLDTAQTYGTERNVGDAIRRSGVARHEFFVTTKVADTHLARKSFLPSVRRSLDTIGVERVDLLLIHWPVPEDDVPFAEYIDLLAEARQQGLTDHIGVSNFPSGLVEAAARRLGPGVLATNQVERHPFLQNRRVRETCERLGMTLTAYLPLARGQAAMDQVIQTIGRAHGVPASAVALAWSMARGVPVIPASGQPIHLADNFKAVSLQLTAADLAAIDALERGQRLIDPAKSPAWD